MSLLPTKIKIPLGQPLPVSQPVYTAPYSYSYPSPTTSPTAPVSTTSAATPAPASASAPAPTPPPMYAYAAPGTINPAWPTSDSSEGAEALPLMPTDLGPFGGGSSPAVGQSPGLGALQGLLGRSSGGGASPALQSLLEGVAGQLGGGQARQRYGRQFQTYLANQQMAQRQRAESGGMDSEMAPSSLQGQMQMQVALDRLRAALDMPSRVPQSRRAPQFASSAPSSGGGLNASSPYLY